MMKRLFIYGVQFSAVVWTLFACGNGDGISPGESTMNRDAEDDDSDGLQNGSDNCPLTKNADQMDADENNVGDACEAIGPFAPRFDILHYEPEKCSDGVTLFAVQGGSKTFDNPAWVDFGYMAAVPMAPDSATETAVEPLFVYADMSTGAFSDIDLLENGNLLVIRGDDGGAVLEEIDPKSETVTIVYDEAMVNHAAQRLPDGGSIFIYSYIVYNDAYGIDPDGDNVFQIRVDAVRVIDKAGKDVWDWDVWERESDATPTDVYVAFTEWWSNCNAVSFLPAEDWTEGDPLEGDVYLNCRLLNRLYKINYPSGEIEWVMGDDGDFGEGFFYHPHDPQISYDVDADGNRTATRILLYDNREVPPFQQPNPCPADETCPADLEPYSRLLEIVVDNDLNAEIVWKWPSPSDANFDAVRFYSPIGGGISKLENGNILATNATDGGNPFIGEVCHGRVLEVVRDGSLTGGEIVWDLNFNQDYGSYKAIRVPSETAAGWNSHVIVPDI